MRRRRAAILSAVLAAAMAGPAAAGPEAGPGFAVAELPVELQIASGVAELDGDLLFTDLGTGRVLWHRGGEPITLATLPVGSDVLGYPTGPYKVAVLDGRVLVSQGWQDVNRTEDGPYDHALLSLDRDGGVGVVAQAFWNPYDVDGGGDRWFLTDSGKNVLFSVSPAGAVAEHFVFPAIVHDRSALQSLSPTEFAAGEAFEAEAVPTGVAVDDDQVYVALFGGFPFLDGGGRVVAVPAAAPGPARIVATGLNAPTDVAIDRDGRLLVLELGRYEVGQGFLPGSGRLLGIDRASGERTVIVDGLTMPATVLPRAAGGYIVTQMGGPVLEVTRQ